MTEYTIQKMNALQLNFVKSLLLKNHGYFRYLLERLRSQIVSLETNEAKDNFYFEKVLFLAEFVNNELDAFTVKYMDGKEPHLMDWFGTEEFKFCWSDIKRSRDALYDRLLKYSTKVNFEDTKDKLEQFSSYLSRFIG